MKETKERNRNNDVLVIGTIVEIPQYVRGNENGALLFESKISIKRKYGQTEDIIPVIFSDEMVNPNMITKGQKLELKGEFQSELVKGEDGKKHLKLYIFPTSISTVSPITEDKNNIRLRAYINKPVIYRTTPLGRKIADMMVVVNRDDEKSDYIPCIAWKDTARWASELKVGDCIRIIGRIQSRNYVKRKPGKLTETKVAYEVSIGKAFSIEE